MLNKVLYAEAANRVNSEQVTKENSTERNNMGNSNDPPSAENRQTRQISLYATSHKCRVKEGTMLADSKFCCIHL